VDLQSTDSSVGLPASVVVPAGQKTASFSITTTRETPATATLTASIGASTATAQLSVVVTASVASVELQSHCLTPDTPFPSNRVNLDVPAPEDTTVDLSSDPDGILSMPESVVVPSGQTSALFSVTGIASGTVTVTGSLGSSQASDTGTVSAVADPKPDLLTLSPESILAGGSSNGVVTLDCAAPEGGTEVTLTAKGPGNAADPILNINPTTVTVPAGADSAPFTVETTGGSDGTLGGVYTITATAGGGTQDATLTVNNQAT
jgi:hypothetical protein